MSVSAQPYFAVFLLKKTALADRLGWNCTGLASPAFPSLHFTLVSVLLSRLGSYKESFFVLLPD